MRYTHTRSASVAAFSIATLLAAPALWAKVSQEEADRLKGDELTPLGAVRAGSEDGVIPLWDGGIDKGRDSIPDGERPKDLFPDDKPLYTITSENLGEYKELLPPGAIALFEKFPDTYKIPVYESRRTAAFPQFYYDATHKYATTAELQNGGDSLVGAVTGIPFPIPQSGIEVIWNHRVRYRGQAITRFNAQAAVQSSGAYNVFLLQEDVKFLYSYPDQEPEDLNNVLVYFLQITKAPPRQSGGILLVHDTLDQVKEKRRAWLYNPGQRRLRRAPNVGYDNPGRGSDGLRTNDQLDVFNGALDRYNWKLVGKKEMLMPYNAGKLISADLKYKDILKPGHLNTDLTRWEKHRVWVVESEVKEGTSHIYGRRTFYVDEDSWSAIFVDIYDKRGKLWRVHVSHNMQVYDEPTFVAVISAVYDLNANRYLTMDMNNEEPVTFRQDFDKKHFTTGNVKKLAKK